MRSSSFLFSGSMLYRLKLERVPQGGKIMLPIFLLIASIVIILFLLFFILRFRGRPSRNMDESPSQSIDDFRWVIEALRRQKPIIVQNLVEKMEQEKDDFLTRIEMKVKNYIASQGTGCLTIVEKNAHGSLHEEWSLAPLDKNYLQRLWKFCRAETIDGHELDSGLTEAVKALVVEEFNEFYQEHVSFLTIEVLRNDAMQSCLNQTISNMKSLGYATQEVQALAVELVLGQVEHALTQKAAHVALAATTLAEVTSNKVALLMVHHFGEALAPLIAKSLAVPAVHKALLLIVKKYVVAAVTTAIIKALAAKLSIGVGAATFLAIAPILIAWVAVDIYLFPEHLGRNVAAKIRSELDASYTSNNQLISHELYEGMLTSLLTVGIDTIMNSMITSPQFETEFERLMAALRGSPLTDVPAL
jgi:hypothetical protein